MPVSAEFFFLCNLVAGKKKVNWPDVFYEAEFYHQAHFIKDFEEFTGRTPQQYLRENAELANLIEKPKIQPYIPAMRKVIAALLAIEENAVSIKATTSEKMGFVGRGEGVAAYASALIESIGKAK